MSADCNGDDDDWLQRDNEGLDDENEWSDEECEGVWKYDVHYQFIEPWVWFSDGKPTTWI